MAPKIPRQIKNIAKLQDPEEFDKRFLSEIENHHTYEQAYEAVESEYQSLFEKRKYTNYNSFRVSRSHRYKHKTD